MLQNNLKINCYPYFTVKQTTASKPVICPKSHSKQVAKNIPKSKRIRSVSSESEVAQSYPTLVDPMECSPPGSSVLGILQYNTGVGSLSFSRGSSRPGIEPTAPTLQRCFTV